jgi:hypothetical protein
MIRMDSSAAALVVLSALSAAPALSRQPAPAPRPFQVGNPLGLPVIPAADGRINAISSNVKVYGSVYSAESCTVVRTERAAQSGNDGIVIMPDGTKYVSSVVLGGVSRIRPGQAAELIAENIPSAASMCYDAGANQLVIPMNANNAVAIIKIP